MPERLQQLKHWLEKDLKLPRFEIEPASGDASFRRYFRISYDSQTYIAMDAPPEKEDCRPFVSIARALYGIGLNVPKVIHEDLSQGFLLLSDLGTQLYLTELNEHTVERLYGDAMTALVTLQACGPGECQLPPYDEKLLRAEMELFREWFLRLHLRIDLSRSEHKLLDQVFPQLMASALAQVQVAVHRDYHSRNLLVDSKHNPGILDFQDAVVGAITYDLVSLLRDCYIDWPKAVVEDWVMGYHDLALQSGLIAVKDQEQFLKWFDWMGVQRHLKAIGIFARLNHRDQKPGYLPDIPRTLRYILQVGRQYSGLRDFTHFLEDRVASNILD